MYGFLFCLRTVPVTTNVDMALSGGESAYVSLSSTLGGTFTVLLPVVPNPWRTSFPLLRTSRIKASGFQSFLHGVLTDKGVSRPHSILFMGANGTCSTPTIVLIQQQCRRMVSSEVAQLWRGTRTCIDTSVDILHESADNHVQEIDPNHQKTISKSPEPRCRRRTTVAGYVTQDINNGHHHGWRCPTLRHVALFIHELTLFRNVQPLGTASRAGPNIGRSS